MTEILTAMAYVSGGLVLGYFVELPIYNTISTTFKKYNKDIHKYDNM